MCFVWNLQMNAKMLNCIETLCKNLEKTVDKKETFEFRVLVYF